MKLRLIFVVLIVAANLNAQTLCQPAETAWTRLIPTRSQTCTDSALRSASGSMVSVSGRVIDATGKLVPCNRETGSPTSGPQTSPTDAQGNLAIEGILRGAALRLQLHGAFSLSGSVSVAGSAAEFEFSRLKIRMLPEDGNGSDVTAAVTKDATFNLTELRPTTYQLRLSGLPDGWYLKSAVFGEENVLNEGLRLKEGDREQRLEIGIRAGASKVQGIVIDPAFHDAVANAVVKLFPDPPNPHRWDLARAARTDEYGGFTLENVVPGKYRILAVMGRVDSVDDSQFAVAAGARLILGERQSKRLELELFEAHR